MDARKREAITKEEAPAVSLSGAEVQTEENRNTSNTEEKSNDTAGIGTPNTEDKTYHPESSTRNANSRMVFRNPTLACQFLKEYVNLPIFQDLRPEDIQDVTDKYKAFLGVEFETDTVKYIRLPFNGRETELFVVSLIEHKSQVDYDVAMQLLRYMALIWYDYKKMRDKQEKDISSRKDFRYPSIIPVVYYEGSKKWTAETQLRFRIQAEGDLLKYVPDFTYHLIALNDYGREEFEEKNDEMSLVMMMNKVQNEEGYREFLQAENRYAERIYDNAPEDIKRIIRDVAWSLLMSMKVPEAEAQKMMEEMGVKGMGYLFENFSGIDIAGDRQRLAEARKELDEARKEVVDARKEVVDARKEAVDARKETADARKEVADARKETADARKEAVDARREAEKAQREAAEAQKKEVEAREETEGAIENFVLYQLSLRTGRKEIEVLLQKIFQKEENEAVCIMDRLIS